MQVYKGQHSLNRCRSERGVLAGYRGRSLEQISCPLGDWRHYRLPTWNTAGTWLQPAKDTGFSGVMTDRTAPVER